MVNQNTKIITNIKDVQLKNLQCYCEKTTTTLKNVHNISKDSPLFVKLLEQAQIASGVLSGLAQMECEI